MLPILILTALLTVPPPSDPGSPPTHTAMTADTASFARSVQHAYAHENTDALRNLLAQAETLEQELLARYRLYPLTEEASVVEGIPDEVENQPPRTVAILSGLWAYRAGEASLFGAMRYGRRSVNLLEDAKERAPHDPYVLLVEGQSLLFRPAIAGRDVEGAADRFRTLVEILESDAAADGPGITVTEAKIWLWLALRNDDQSDAAQSLYDALVASDLEPLYRQFLDDPPSV